MIVKYKSDNGYTGVLDDNKHSLTVYGIDGKRVMHTSSPNVKTIDELVSFVDRMPHWISIMDSPD